MEIREFLIEHIKSMEKEDLILIYQIIKSMERRKKIKRFSQKRGYLLTRQALSGLKEPLSKTIIAERQDRL